MLQRVPFHGSASVIPLPRPTKSPTAMQLLAAGQETGLRLGLIADDAEVSVPMVTGHPFRSRQSSGAEASGDALRLP